SITATFSGGTAPYTISIDGGAAAPATSPFTFSSLTPVSHSIVVQDAHNCQLSKPLTVAEPPALALGLTHVDVTCRTANDGSITATFSGGTAPYTISIDGGADAPATSPFTLDR